MKKFNQLAKKKKKKKNSIIKTKVAIKVPKKKTFFSAKNQLGTERVKVALNYASKFVKVHSLQEEVDKMFGKIAVEEVENPGFGDFIRRFLV